VPVLADDYPHQSRALGQEDGFNSANPTMQKIMQLLLAELIDLLSSSYELNVIDSANNYPKFESLRLPVINHSRTPKNGWALPSKLPYQNTEAPTNLPTTLPIPLLLLQGLSLCCMQDPKNCPMQAYECNSILINVVCITN
jgi:hypothetical protein